MALSRWFFPLLGALSACAQDDPATSPTFRANSQLVQINVIVQGKSGPVANLTKDDFTLTDKGKPRQIAVFSVDVRASGKTLNVSAEPNTFGNRNTENPGSVTIILLDRLNTLNSAGVENYEDGLKWNDDHALAFAKQKLMQFLKEMGPQDRVAIYSLGEGLSVISDFTSDSALLQNLLTNYKATSLTAREKVEPNQIHTPTPEEFNMKINQERQVLASVTNTARTVTTLRALASIAGHVVDIPGRKSLVWLSASLPFPGAAAATAVSRANIAIYPVDARGLLPKGQGTKSGAPDFLSGVLKTGGSGDAANFRPPGTEAMEAMAQATGGRAFTNTNDLTGAIRRAMDDSAVTYTLGFYPDSASLDGKFHELKVRVKQGGAEVRYPKGYFALKDDSSEAQKRNSLMTAVASPLESSLIHLNAKISRPASSEVSIQCQLDLKDVEVAQKGDTWKGVVDVYLVQQDAAGKLLDRKFSRYDLHLTHEQYLKYLKAGVFFNQSIEPKPGLATLRVLVEDPSNSAVGSLIIPASKIP